MALSRIEISTLAVWHVPPIFAVILLSAESQDLYHFLQCMRRNKAVLGLAGIEFASLGLIRH